MAGTELIRLQHFDVAAIAAPPALLCHQLLQADTDGDRVALLAQNPALLLRVLDAQVRLQRCCPRATLTERVGQLDVLWLHALLTDMSLQLVLRGTHHPLLHLLLWQEARYTALLARLLAERSGLPDVQRVELAALLLYAGKFLLEQQHGASWVNLYLDIESSAALPDAERASLGIDHIDAGAELLRSWQLDQECIDALRVQAATQEAVQDATPLVRHCWLARQLATLRPEGLAAAHAAAAILLGLEPEVIDTLLQDAHAQLANELSAWGGCPELLQGRQLPEDGQQRVAQHAREGLQQLQRQLLSASALRSLEQLETTMPSHAAALRWQATPLSGAVAVSDQVYRQRVREAIHEVSSPLTIIKNYLHKLQLSLGDAVGNTREIGIINGEIDRVAGILAALRNDEAAPAAVRDVDLNALLRSMHRILAQAFSVQQAIHIELDLADDPVLVHANPDALKQILTNLVTNAAEALGTAGHIVLATRRNVFQNQALYQQLSVADDGPGMATAQMARLCKAGSTTKAGSHRGNGLAIVKRLVDAMAGLISCQSDSKGTVISIFLPQRPW